MKSHKIVNGLALVGAMIIILAVGSAANTAFAEPLVTSLNSAPTTTFEN